MRSLMPFALAGAVLTLLASGCGGSGQRKAVTHYIERVNVIEAALATPLETVTRAGGNLGAISTPGKKYFLSAADLRRQLTQSERRIDSLAKQLAAVDAPPPAHHLRALLIQLAREQAALAHEVVLLVEYLPRFNAALHHLAPATQHFQHEIAVARHMTATTKTTSKSTAAKQQAAALLIEAAAFKTYDSELGPIIRELRRLHPPPVATPAYQTQLSGLERIAASAASVVHSIELKRLSDLPRLIHNFEAASLANQSTSAQRAQIVALSSYNRRVQHLDVLATQIQTEQHRLETAVH